MRRGMVGRIRGRKTKERAVNNNKTGREAAVMLGGLVRSVHDTFEAICLQLYKEILTVIRRFSKCQY